MRKRILALPLILLLIATSSSGALAQSATPGADPAIDDHVSWILGLFEGEADQLTPADVESRFTDQFLSSVPADEFIATVQQLATVYGPLELVEDQSTDPGEFVGVFESTSGEYVMISFAVDPQSGLMAGFFVTPAQAPGTPAASPVATPPGTPEPATPVASPVAAGPVVEDPGAQIALHDEITTTIRDVGEPVVDATLAGDDAALEPYLSPELASSLESMPISDVVDSYTSRQVQMVFAEAGAWFFGQWSDSTISGVMVQNGVPYPFTLEADEDQAGDLPSGRFSGSVQQAQLELSVTFGTDDAGDLTAILDIPAQNVTDHPLQDVQYLAERPVGDRVDERVFAPGGVNNSYTADFAWGDHLLRVTVGVGVEAGQAVSLQVFPAIPTPPPAEDTPEPQSTFQPPFEGTWWVFWGGETELHNYHAATPSQRYAYDLVIWKDGATYSGDGTSNEDYWAWGQPALAPVDGTVVDMANDYPDIEPNLPVDQRGDPQNILGNHVVIESAENEFVFVAHMQRGSVQVSVGDEVRAGDLLGLTGNSGNSSEPHIHVHAQETSEILDFQANGIPMPFETVVVDGEPRQDVIPTQGSFIASP